MSIWLVLAAVNIFCSGAVASMFSHKLAVWKQFDAWDLFLSIASLVMGVGMLIRA